VKVWGDRQKGCGVYGQFENGVGLQGFGVDFISTGLIA
jgi:hypothetical protein